MHAIIAENILSITINVYRYRNFSFFNTNCMEGTISKTRRLQIRSTLPALGALPLAYRVHKNT
jgi:hypothetical protein